MFTGFDKLIADVRSLEAELSAPSSFYQSHREEYYAQARAIAMEVLSAMRPRDMKPEEWKRRIDRVIDRVTTELLAGGNGIVFLIAEPETTADGSLAPKANRPQSQIMSYEDIKEWIRAGIRGEPGGKRIDRIDEKTMREKGIDGVASIVMKAYYSSNPDPRYARLRSAIQRYFLGARAAESSPLLDAVATAWEQHFAVVIPRDLERHAARLCRGF